MEARPENQEQEQDLTVDVGRIAALPLISPEDREALHLRLDEILDEANIQPTSVTGIRVNQWDGMIKNNDGEIETRTLRSLSLLAPVESSKPVWETVKRVESEPIPYKAETNFEPGEYRREVVLPDLQIGFRKFEDGSTDPFHDEEAISIALQILDEVKPSRVVLLGDFLDLPEFSRYEQTPEFAQTTNMSIEYGHQLLRTIREMLPESEIILLEGNHDRRLEKAVRSNMMAAYGIKRAGEELPALSVPYLLGLDKLGVKYVGAYPAGRFFITPQLQAIHGTVTKKMATAKALNEYEDVSTIQGHSHRIERYSRTRRTYNGARQTHAFSPGTLSRIDGAVPGVRGSTEVDGRPVTNYEDWQQGLAVVEHNGMDFTYHQVAIPIDKKTRFNGKTFKPISKQ